MAGEHPKDPLQAVGEPDGGASPDEGGAARAASWRSLRHAADQQEYARAWLALQCAALDGVEQAVVVSGAPNRGPFTILATWPAGMRGSPGLSAAIEAAVSERKPVVQGRRYADPVRSRHRDAVAVPILVDDQLCGAVALEVAQRPEPELRALLESLEWGAAWLESMVRRKTFTARDRLVTVLNMVATSLHEQRFQGAATAVATELSGLLGCERVSIGFLKGRHTRVRALSHSASFGKKANLTRDIEAAMDEAIDQESTVVIPAAEEASAQVTRCHAELARLHGAGAVCTVPFVEGERFLGALTLELPEGERFERQTVELCEHAASLVGPVLDVKRKEDRLLPVKAWDSLIWLVHALVGPRRVALKLSAATVVTAIVFFTFATGQYRITADATLEGTVQRAVSAPLPGYIESAEVRAGDVVEEGAVLVTLDDRDLRLERLKWVSQAAQRRREYSEALARHDRAQVRILGAQIEQAEAQLALLDEQLARTRITAPFEGVVVGGDLSQSLGAPVERGDVLFEIAPLDTYRIILEVEERDVDQVRVGQTGEVALSGLPEQALAMTVERITPVSAAAEGRNYFRVEARLDTLTPAVRPGMEGVGKIAVDERKLVWIWTHKIAHWLRMFIWSWWP